MIFFLTTITPSSNVEAEINNAKKKLFRKGILIPLPFTLIPVRVSLSKIQRPNRREIAEQYPAELTPERLRMEKGNIILSISETPSCETDRGLEQLLCINQGSIDFGLSPASEEFHGVSEDIHFSSFRNYSLTMYEIECEDPANWRSNMSWVKLWDVKKSKPQKDFVS